MDNVQNFDSYSLPQLVPWLRVIEVNAVIDIHDSFLLDIVTSHVGFVAYEVLSADCKTKSLYINTANKSFANEYISNSWQ
jgi:hypothetical protein